MSEAPQRAVTLKLDLQADTPAALIRALENIACQIERGELSTGCSGGYESGYTYEYHEANGPSHDEYVKQLQTYCATRLDARAAPPQPAEPK